MLCFLALLWEGGNALLNLLYIFSAVIDMFNFAIVVGKLVNKMYRKTVDLREKRKKH